MINLLKENQVIEVLILSSDYGEHPFHLHGHEFYVLGTGNDTFSWNTSRINYQNPLRRDTFTVPHFGWGLIRFITNNPGTWLFHCVRTQTYMNTIYLYFNLAHAMAC